jgi:hypothetical protein
MNNYTSNGEDRLVLSNAQLGSYALPDYTQPVLESPSYDFGTPLQPANLAHQFSAQPAPDGQPVLQPVTYDFVTNTAGEHCDCCRCKARRTRDKAAGGRDSGAGKAGSPEGLPIANNATGGDSGQQPALELPHWDVQ